MLYLSFKILRGVSVHASVHPYMRRIHMTFVICTAMFSEIMVRVAWCYWVKMVLWG